MTLQSKLEDKSKLTSAQYNLPSFEKFTNQMEAAVRLAVDDFIRGAIGESASMYFPYSSREFNKDKPLLASISVALGDDDNPPVWRFDIEEEIRNFVDDRSYADNSRPLDGKDREAVQVVRDKLAELVSHYDRKLAVSTDWSALGSLPKSVTG